MVQEIRPLGGVIGGPLVDRSAICTRPISPYGPSSRQRPCAGARPTRSIGRTSPRRSRAWPGATGAKSAIASAKLRLLLDRQVAEGRSLTVWPAPFRQTYTAVAHLAGLEPIVIIGIAPSAPTPVIAGVFGHAALLDFQQRQMQLAISPRHGRGEQTGHGGIGALQRGKAKFRLRVGMLQRG